MVLELESLSIKIHSVLPFMDEHQQRIYLASEAKMIGRGGNSLIAKIAKVSRVRINKGHQELLNNTPKISDTSKIRATGGGRNKAIQNNPDLLLELEALISPHTRGDPMNALLWVSKSLRTLSEELEKKGFIIGHVTVSKLLKKLGYSLQANKKTDEGATQEDRNKQFEYINTCTNLFTEKNNPVISVDCKKKELIGNFKNAGQEVEVKGHPIEVKAYDFSDKEKGKAVPYGVYDIASNEGLVNVGISADTAEFAVNSIRTWWKTMGIKLYGDSKELMITADGGGSNSTRGRLWKIELQKFATESGLIISVCHFPPGTSKWNKIEHKMFSFISMNWRAKPLESIEVIVNLIANTTTKSGLKINAQADTNKYEKGIKITDTQINALNIKRNEFRGEWNYILYPILSDEVKTNESIENIVNPIKNTTQKNELEINMQIDTDDYQEETKITDTQINGRNIKRKRSKFSENAIMFFALILNLFTG